MKNRKVIQIILMVSLAYTTFPVMAAHLFECEILPAVTGTLDQTTTVKITDMSKNRLPDTAKVVAYLGENTDRPLGSVCGYQFYNKKAIISPVILQPQITDEQYPWICNAKIIDEPCPLKK